MYYRDDSDFRVLIAGGSTNNAGNAGVFYLNSNNDSSNRNRNISARLAVNLIYFRYDRIVPSINFL